MKNNKHLRRDLYDNCFGQKDWEQNIDSTEKCKQLIKHENIFNFKENSGKRKEIKRVCEIIDKRIEEKRGLQKRFKFSVKEFFEQELLINELSDIRNIIIGETQICPNCNGSGVEALFYNGLCSTCNGIGEIKLFDERYF